MSFSSKVLEIDLVRRTDQSRGRCCFVNRRENVGASKLVCFKNAARHNQVMLLESGVGEEKWLREAVWRASICVLMTLQSQKPYKKIPGRARQRRSFTWSRELLRTVRAEANCSKLSDGPINALPFSAAIEFKGLHTFSRPYNRDEYRKHEARRAPFSCRF